MCSPKVCGSKSYTLGINDLSVTGTNGKKATRLCFCGYLGHPNGKCHCTPDQITRYRTRIPGPLLDRIDMQIEVPAIPQKELMQLTSGWREKQRNTAAS
ncbi:MAG: ATP-binding protein [Nitrosomonas sp.]|uniref:ATP-binding protein n=1 Tax=Nitrosomonas sp. TaxID=42353 RepID=UPI00272F508E|nr:ATP-binding protein [Nitrosomonas sp.]MDP1549046.1 ATP-binding protein [Nitrosomonas sp.]